MIDEEACLPAFASEIDSLESSDAEDFAMDDTNTNCGNHSSYIKRLEHAIEYLTSGKKVLNTSVGLHSSDGVIRKENESSEQSQKNRGVPEFNASEHHPDQARGTTLVEDDSPTPMIYDGKKGQETRNNQNISNAPIYAGHTQSSSNDTPISHQHSKYGDTGEMHEFGSLIMPPKVVAMWDTEVDGEAIDARASNYRNNDRLNKFSTKLGLMGGTGRQNLQQTTRRTRSSKTAAEKVTKDSKPKKPTKVSARARQPNTAFLQSDKNIAGSEDYTKLKSKTSKHKLLEKFIKEPVKGLPTNPDKVAIPSPFDPYKEVWHRGGPSQIYLPDSHYAANMISAEVEWDLAQGKSCNCKQVVRSRLIILTDPKRRGDPMYGPTDPRSCLNPLKRPRRPPVSGQSRLPLPEISSKYDMDKLRKAGILKF